MDSFYYFDMVDVFDAGTGGDNEVARVRLPDGRDCVLKVMLSNKKYHQRRKALTEMVFCLLDKGLGKGRVSPDVEIGLFTSPSQTYVKHWGATNSEGAKRVCYVLRDYCAGGTGIDWREKLHTNASQSGWKLAHVDATIKYDITHSLQAERISLLDFVTINQDRSARNWGYDWDTDHFWAFDNGMAWFHEYPYSDDWQYGCAIDDVILQVNEWQFISGVFSTLWKGRQLSDELSEALRNFDYDWFLAGVDSAACSVGYPAGISGDWRFKAMTDRMKWIAERNRQPTSKEYHSWFNKGNKYSYLMNPHAVVENGGEVIWEIEMDKTEG